MILLALFRAAAKPISACRFPASQLPLAKPGPEKQRTVQSRLRVSRPKPATAKPFPLLQPTVFPLLALTLRHGHGSQFLAEDFQPEIAFPGIMDPASCVREPLGTASPRALPASSREIIVGA